MNKTEPAIVVVTYNRPKSLTRLLNSIANANYDTFEDIVLVISIDGGSPTEMQEIADNFDWYYGKKVVIVQPINLGLRKHIIACGDLTETYGSVIILEDDLFVSPNYYDFTSNAINFYQEEKKIAGISVFSYNQNEYEGLPFVPLKDKYDTFFMQIPSSWGQAWTKLQWQSFKEFYNTAQILNTDKLPETVKSWPESSWKKYFYKYLVDKDLYFVYPYIAYSTNFGDVGTHFDNTTNMFQVPLALETKKNEYAFNTFQNSNVKYDAYFELLPECLKKMGILTDKDFCVDVYGGKQLDLFDNQYCISTKECLNPIESFGVNLVPIENNIIHNVLGNTVFFANKKDFKTVKPLQTSFKIVSTYSNVAFTMGTYNGIRKGEENIRASKIYKIGKLIELLIHPSNIIGTLRRKFK